MNKTLTRWYTPKGGRYGNKDNCRHCSTTGTAWNDCVPANQEQEKEREVNKSMKKQEEKKAMNNRCPKCGRFIRKNEPICPDCLEAIGRIIQEEVFPDSKVVVIKPNRDADKAVSKDSEERLFLLGRRSPDDLALHDASTHYGLNNGFALEDEDDWEYDDEFDDELDDEFDDEDDWEDDYDDDAPTFTEFLKDGVFVGLFVPGGKKKVTIKVE